MNIVLKYIKTLLLSIIFFMTGLLVLPLLLLLSLLPESKRYDNRLYFSISAAWAWFIIKVSGIKVIIHGREHLPTYPNNPSIIISNHVSAFDIPFLEILLGNYPHVWVSKAGYLRIPLWGTILKRMHVSVERDDLGKALPAMKRILKLIKNQRRHLIIFPEGTRYSDGKLHRFHEGFFLIAKKLDRPVIPIVIVGLHTIFPRNSFMIDSSASVVKISIGQPMHYTHDVSREQFIQNVHSWCKQEIQKLNS